MTDNIKPIQPSVMEWLGSQVIHGQYSTYDDQSGFPQGIHKPENHKLSVLIGTRFTGQAIEISSDLIPALGGMMYFQKTFRECCHDGTPHQNADITIYWTATNGISYRANAGTSPDHYRLLFDGSACQGIGSWLSSGSMETGALDAAGLNISVSITGNGPRSDY